MDDTIINPEVFIEKVPVFEPNQVLTSKNLNDLRDFLDIQNLLTRSKLIGKGIGKGLEVSFLNNKITISQGSGATSQGYFVSLKENNIRSFNKYRTFIDTGRNYPPFWKNDIQINLLELLPNSETGDNVKYLSELQAFPDQKIVMLYVQIDDQDIKPCFSQNCDDKGIVRRLILRCLLIDIDEISTVFNGINSSLSNYPSGISYQLPLVRLKGFRFASSTPEAFQDAYTEICSDGIITELSLALNQSYIVFKKYIDSEYKGQNPFINIASILKQLREKCEDNLQYFYDFLSDIIRVYDDFKEIATKININPITSDQVFERHICLGPIEYYGSPQLLPYRHHFENSVQQKNTTETINKLIAWHKRIYTLITEFNPLILKTKALKLTPGAFKHKALGKQAIPFYYSPVNGEGDTVKYWDPERLTAGSWKQNLSYFSNQYSGNNPCINNPLEYKNDESGFLRIEGYVGMEKEALVKKLEEIRLTHYLSFDIKPLSLHADSKTEENLFEYIQKHTGIRHLCGVNEGGTFIPVYLLNDEGVEIVVGDFALPYLCCGIEQQTPIIIKAIDDLEIAEIGSIQDFDVLENDEFDRTLPIDLDFVDPEYALKAVNDEFSLVALESTDIDVLYNDEFNPNLPIDLDFGLYAIGETIEIAEEDKPIDIEVLSNDFYNPNYPVDVNFVDSYFIYVAKDGKYRWRIYDQTGEIILNSEEGYKTKEEIYDIFQKINKIIFYDKNIQYRTSKRGSFYINIIDDTGEIIGRSQEYHDTQEERSNEIRYLRSIIQQVKDGSIAIEYNISSVN